MLKLLPLSHFQAIYYYTHVIYICVHFLPPLIGIWRQNTNKHILLSSCIDSRFIYSVLEFLWNTSSEFSDFDNDFKNSPRWWENDCSCKRLFFKTSETHRSFCLRIFRIILVSIWLLQWFIFVLVLNFMKEKVCYFFIQLITLYLPQHHTNKPWSKNFMDLYFLYETVIIHVSTVTVHSMSTKILAVIQLVFADIEFNSIVVFISYLILK